MNDQKKRRIERFLDYAAFSLMLVGSVPFMMYWSHHPNDAAKFYDENLGVISFFVSTLGFIIMITNMALRRWRIWPPDSKDIGSSGSVRDDSPTEPIIPDGQKAEDNEAKQLKRKRKRRGR